MTTTRNATTMTTATTTSGAAVNKAALREVALDESQLRVPPSEADAAQRPLPTGSDIARKRAPLANVPTQSVRSALIDSVKAATAAKLDGPALLAQRLDEIERIVQSGEQVRCVFDLDNTLFDTRGRTLHALRVYDAENGTTYATGLTERDMHDDGRKTAIALQLRDDVVEAIGKVWDREFWNPHNLVHDGTIDSMVELAKEAQKRGAELVFLTGRTEDHGFRGPTMAQLARAGLACEDACLLHKPSLGVRTAPYKEAEVMRLAEDATLGFFVTEGRRDMDHLSRAIDGLVGFLLDSTFEAGGPACASVPVLPGPF